MKWDIMMLKNKEFSKKQIEDNIPNGWKIEKFGDLVEIEMGQSPLSSTYNLEGNGVYLIQGNADIKNRKSNPRLWTSKPKKICNKGDILMTVRAPVGAVAKSLHSACIGRGVCAINSSLMDKEFLYQYLISYETSWKRLEQGSTFTAINSKDVKSLLINLPPLKEQQKIGKVLSKWDEAIETTRQLLEQLEFRKKALMQQLLTGKKRLAGFDGKWEEKKIKDVAESFSKKNTNNEKIAVLSCTKYDGLVPSLEYFGRKVYGDDLSKYKIVPRDYFAYATNHIEEGSIGYQNIWDRGLVSPMYTVFKTIEQIDDSFFFRYLKTDRMIYKYQSNMTGSIARRGGLRWKAFGELVIKIPCLKEQSKLAEIFNLIDFEIDETKKYLKQLQLQKKGLMQKLLTGKIRVKV